MVWAGIFHGAQLDGVKRHWRPFAPTTPSQPATTHPHSRVRAGSCMSAAVLGTAVGPLTASSGVSLVLTRVTRCLAPCDSGGQLLSNAQHQRI